MTTPVTPKSGFVSSEFFVTVGTMITLITPGIPHQYQPIMAALGGIYVAARTLLKAVHAAGFAKSIPDLPDTQENK